MIGLILIFTLVAVASGIMVALLIRLAHSRSWYDRTSERRVHTGNVPRLGGLGFVPVFVVATSVILISQNDDFIRFLPTVVGICVITFFGVWDDFRPLRPSVKLLIQIGAALCVVIPGYVFRRAVFFDESLLLQFPWIGPAVTVLWLVGMTNAVNLIDGVDALAGGVSMLAALTFGFIFFSYAEIAPAVMIAVALAGSVLGFLAFNAPFPKARIFMGDGGSQSLGFILALLPLIEERYTIATLPVLYVAAILAIPIFDTASAVWRRVRDRKPLSSPDRLHIHHKLMNLGLDARKVCAVLLGLQTVVSAMVVASLKFAEYRPAPSLVLLGLTYVAVMAFFTVIHFMNKKRTAGLDAEADDANLALPNDADRRAEQSGQPNPFPQSD